MTAREQEVLELAEQGLANKDIAQELQIRTGTVKIHMKHIFEKTGIHGRHSLALAGLLDREPVHLRRVEGHSIDVNSFLDRAFKASLLFLKFLYTS